MSGPGRRLRSVAERVCQRSTMERLVDPIVADFQAEYAAAGPHGWRRTLVRLRAYVAFCKALTLHVVLSAVPARANAEARLLRVVSFSVLAFVLVTISLVLPPLLNGAAWRGSWMHRLLLSLLLVPQALPISIPIGLCIGILCAMRTRSATRREVLGVLTIGLAASAAVWLVVDQGLPRANHAFRQLVLAQISDGRAVHLEPGLNELGFARLAERTSAAAVRLYHVLWALCFAPIPLGLFSLSLAVRIRSGWAAATVACLALFGYYTALWTSESVLRDGTTLPALVAWTPNLLFATAGALILGMRRGADRERGAANA